MTGKEEDKSWMGQVLGRRDHADSVDEKAIQESGELAALTANIRHRLKNGCCKDCMKAFSKSGKVGFAASVELSVPGAPASEKVHAAVQGLQVLRLQRVQPHRHEEG
eukprot:TRINITY_DN5627_c0_g1_i10.p3 TRINITY_DN5627_c0_g1~~TRINITY_DN5627_c0_g1_i10.p3  ORF type:complete len:107 (-),score=32.19 TRINITY_DN5627_c0_g1_i10:415-735(-)